MNVVNRKPGRTGSESRAWTIAEITLEQLFGLSLDRIVNWTRRKMLQAHLRSLHGMAEYFAWQQENGAAGLADAHKRIAMAKSDLRRLQEH
jgi:hypothetical protein